MDRAAAIEKAKTFTYESLGGSRENREQFTELYKVIYNVSHCSGCKSKTLASFAIFRRDFILNEIISKMERTYFLKKGILISQHGSTVDYTDANMDDDTARAILKGSPKSIALFEKYPADWEKECGLVAADPVVKAAAMGKQPAPPKKLTAKAMISRIRKIEDPAILKAMLGNESRASVVSVIKEKLKGLE